MVSLPGVVKSLCSNTYRIGEKFLEWTDETPSLNDILASVSLYWLTDTCPRAIYPYREVSYFPSPPLLTFSARGKHVSVPAIEMAYCTDALCGDRVSVPTLHIMVHLAFISTSHSGILTFPRTSIQFLSLGWLQPVSSVGRTSMPR
jgi:hypothetical protein